MKYVTMVMLIIIGFILGLFIYAKFIRHKPKEEKITWTIENMPTKLADSTTGVGIMDEYGFIWTAGPLSDDLELVGPPPTIRSRSPSKKHDYTTIIIVTDPSQNDKW